MASEQDELLKSFITGVQQRPQFGPTGRPTQTVVASFKTPHGFEGTVTMPLTEWADSDARAKRVFQAIMDLEGPFWEGESAPAPGG